MTPSTVIYVQNVRKTMVYIVSIGQHGIPKASKFCYPIEVSLHKPWPVGNKFINIAMSKIWRYHCPNGQRWIQVWHLTWCNAALDSNCNSNYGILWCHFLHCQVSILIRLGFKLTQKISIDWTGHGQWSISQILGTAS